ncbi:hypothetical protein H7Y40_00065 [Pedobacter sp.]|nr:hypothetical protein [Candidatus Saccharibacteria bacterium]
MAATTTAQLSSIRKKLEADYPQFSFVVGTVSHWSPADKTIYYHQLKNSGDLSTLFHEFGHALSGHTGFNQDISLLRMEREAWEAGSSVAKTYDHTIDDETIENALDSYRDWLHARSRCPTCHNPGIQKKDAANYHCLLCATSWRANDARQCGLKRYTTYK